VRLYQAVLPDVSVDTMDDGGTRTVATHRAMGRAFSITPVPRHTDALCRAVKVETGPRLTHVAAYELKMYEPMPSAGDDLALPSTEAPMLGSAPIPLSTTELVPLVVVVPATPAVAIPSAADQAAAAAKEAQAKALRLERAKNFFESIMTDLVEIPESGGMQLLHNVMDLETGRRRDIIIRSIAIDFWNECMEVLNTPDCTPRLCVVGTPGIGKSTITAFFIRKLLQEHKTVVYLVRARNKCGWYYEFIPKKDAPLDLKVYREKVSIEDIESLSKDTTYYVVDPGQTKNSCLPLDESLPKFMLVSSPDEKHWGKSELKKDRGDAVATFKYYPIWDWEEIWSARSHFSTKVEDDELLKRFRQMGGVPRNLFTKSFSLKVQDQVKAINLLTKDQIIHIVNKRLDALGTFAAEQPRSAIIGYAKDNPHLTYSTEKIVIVSPSVADYVYVKYIQDLWDEMVKGVLVDSTKVFETYCRALMTLQLPDRGKSKLRKPPFKRRPCVGKNDTKGYETVTRTSVGHCSESRMVPDIVKAAKEHPMVLFHSTNPRHALYDFMYRSTKGIFYAFQATIGDRHNAPTSLMEELRKQLGSSKLEIYYMVTEDKFDKFVTNPVGPFSDDPKTTVWHLRVPKPNGIPLVGSSYLVKRTRTSRFNHQP
jgi:hypothetical protein